ncbi:MAG: tRNA uridine-5-carboxymethylaminomethyl(34) synthesis GTPase MnmE [Lachnospiraceae bacterium]|nr:tRNA uridine-5-carboxymethylaminomethyl(34) synthesis GTPase MnmE [Lachnospiraceae bacterium]
MINDTIAAIATALNDSGIGIIRISGDDSIKIADKIFVNKEKEHVLLSFLSHTIHYGFIVDNDEIIDEVMISIMKAPNSFTKENVVEINCHGGVLICKKVLEIVLKNGARLSEPGEFTKRAFLNGRIDLSEAEAVMDLISSKSNSSLKNSLKILSGKLYNKIKSIRESLLYEIAFIESALDDPEHFSLEGYGDNLADKINGINSQLDSLIESFSRGKFVKEGISTVIVGKPNVGKSSLLNLLTRQEKAIVTDIAGTTRDVIETSVVFHDILLNLVDTAGIRETDDVVENIGVSRAKKFAMDADLILFMLDSSKELSDDDKEIISLIQDKQVIVLLNKSDLGSVLSKETILPYFGNQIEVIPFSALSGDGEEILGNLINNMFFSGNISADDELMITKERQANELSFAKNSLSLVIDSINNCLPEDFFSIDLLNAYQALGRIIGEEVDDDVVDEIFSKFCMGK